MSTQSHVPSRPRERARTGCFRHAWPLLFAVALLACSSSDPADPFTGSSAGAAAGASGSPPATGGSSNGGTGAGGSSASGAANGGSGQVSGGGNGGAGSSSAGSSPGGTSGGGSAGAAGSAGASAGGAGAGGSAGSGGGGELPDATIWIAGDSTVATSGGNPCPVGWGGQFDALFNDKVTVVNSAVGGRSVRTWLYDVGDTMDDSGECVLAVGGDGEPTLQQRWQAMLDGMKQGDYLFIQFGINDGSATCPRHVGLTAFKTTYGMMAQAAKERGAQPVFVTPVSAVACTGSDARGTRGSYVTATQEAGVEYDVPVIDLHGLSVELYDSLGFCPIPGGDVSASTTGPVGEFFCNDHTHFDQPGAVQIASLVADALAGAGVGLSAYLK